MAAFVPKYHVSRFTFTLYLAMQYLCVFSMLYNIHVLLSSPVVTDGLINFVPANLNVSDRQMLN